MKLGAGIIYGSLEARAVMLACPRKQSDKITAETAAT
jgi:hypothetical protein